MAGVRGSELDSIEGANFAERERHSDGYERYKREQGPEPAALAGSHVRRAASGGEDPEVVAD